MNRLTDEEIESARKADLLPVISFDVHLKKRGREWEGLCPFHQENSPSFKYNEVKNTFKCFGCNKGGNDAISYLVHRGMSFKDAVNHLNGNAAHYAPIQKVAKTQDDSVTWEATEGTLVPCSSFIHPGYGLPSKVWEYHRADGRISGYACRFELPDGKKDVLPRSYCVSSEGKHTWKWKAQLDPRPLYNLLKLIDNPEKPVLLVEGEKTCDKAQEMFPELVCITWAGGSNAVAYTDFEPLRGRMVLISPDNDLAGFKVKTWIELTLKELDCITGTIYPMSQDKGWDLADFIGDPVKLYKTNILPVFARMQVKHLDNLIELAKLNPTDANMSKLMKLTDMRRKVMHQISTL